MHSASLQVIGVEPRELRYIGDMDIDRLAAAAAGASFQHADAWRRGEEA